MKLLIGTVTFFLALNANAAATQLHVNSFAPAPIGNCKIDIAVNSAKKPKAVALIIHGSGPVDIDGNIAGFFPMYKPMAEELAKNGVTAIRFAKRSSIANCVPSLNSPALSYRVFINDAVNVYKAAAKKESLQGLPLTIIGHSQGVNFAFDIAANKSLNVKKVVAIAGLGKETISESLIRQLKAQHAAHGTPEDQKQALAKSIAKGEAFFKKLDTKKYDPNEFYFGAYATYWKDYIQFTGEAAKTARKSNVPAFIIYGSQDNNVTMDDYNALVSATKKVPGSTSKLYQNMTHILNVSPQFEFYKPLAADIANFIVR